MEEEPAKKKQKMYHEEKDLVRNRFDDILYQMKTSDENLSPVLSDELISECPKIDVYIGTIRNKKDLSHIVKSLNAKLPMSHLLRHIKRVKDNDVIIDTVNQNEDLKIKLEEHKLLEYFDTSGDFKIVSVVAKEPTMRWQYDLTKQSWPSNFHPNKDLERMYNKEFFSSDEVAQHRMYMAAAYDIGIIVDNISCDKVVNLIDQNDTYNSAIKELKKVRGAVVVDPKINSIVSVGYDFRSVHPCQHHIMIAIDNVAKTQNGGNWNTPQVLTDDNTFNDDNDDTLNYHGVPTILRRLLKTKYPDLKFGASPFKTRDRTDPNNDDVSGPYLCTNYFVYSTNEPCVMCAMALVHSRAKRVFFALENSSNGGLISKCKLHTLPHLNHHYDVFTGFFHPKRTCNAQSHDSDK